MFCKSLLSPLLEQRGFLFGLASCYFNIWLLHDREDVRVGFESHERKSECILPTATDRAIEVFDVDGDRRQLGHPKHQDMLGHPALQHCPDTSLMDLCLLFVGGYTVRGIVDCVEDIDTVARFLMAVMKNNLPEKLRIPCE